MKQLDILTKIDAISVVKENKTSVDYYLFDEFEIHQNRIPPNSKQEWHMHKIIEEVIVVTAGEIEVKWKENNEIKGKVVSKGAVVRVEKSIHTVENKTNSFAEFIVFRMVPEGSNKREIIKNDKVVMEEI
ncbi:hypothetical protein [Clostridium sp. 'White wine YQ']|uniref:hypothetical protein n=1 Tax=Clostridium sp. 'White wine YQ' TaxID=3027474 RepID=UPI002365A73E|nr:hypothetical protein [Clostridium sp. 'White wine YQ']MDD7793085.1 hypothetical protein [Clostridium sp. 'White wine YQ']